MRPDALAPWISLVLSLIALASIVYGWFTSGEKSNATALTKYRETQATVVADIDDKIEAHDRRIQTVETELKHLPDKDSVVELKLAIADLKGTVGRLDESLNSVQRTVLRIDDWLRTDRPK